MEFELKEDNGGRKVYELSVEEDNGGKTAIKIIYDNNSNIVTVEDKDGVEIYHKTLQEFCNLLLDS